MPTQTGYTGMAEVNVGDEVSRLYEQVRIELDTAAPVNSGVVLHAPGSSALGRVTPGGTVSLIKQDREVFGIRGRSAEQRVALDLLMDDSVGIVSLGGRVPGSRRSYKGGLRRTGETRRHRR